ncbi:MAG: hypothetical protein LQ343_001592 [Gyalolechia ehrenbergii]|nr:MAG: hypothetical protein LQ343_001592 [Gyalolechia ehrenbergii]
MSHKARVSALTTKLLAQFGLSELGDQSGYASSRKERVFQALLDPKPATANQFEIAARLGGLEEKFRVFSNDELADALRGRLDELYTRPNRWTPEILSLMLALSDDPLHETKIEGLHQSEPVSQPSLLTWSDIIHDDPLDNRDGVWNNVDFARDGSDEDADSIIQVSPLSEASSTTSDDSNCITEAIQGLSTAPDWDGLKTIMDGQFWNHAVQGAHDVNGINHISRDSTIELTEAQGIREIGFVLCGLPASIYEQQPDGRLIASSRYLFKHMSHTVSSQLLNNFATIGFNLASVRIWATKKQQQPLLQTFQAVLAKKLAETERSLIQIQTQCLQSQGRNTTSLLYFYEKVKNETRLIQQFVLILDELSKSESTQASFYILELLYNRVCIGHGIGDMTSFSYAAEIFFACLQTYLKPLKHWMEHGELMRQNQGIFIQECNANIPLDSFWADRYQLLLDGSGQLHAPAFFRLAASQILNTGKSVHFLRLLGYSAPENYAEEYVGFQMNVDCFVAGSDAGPLSPFSESFERALNEWIGNSYHSSSALLQQKLDAHCGLYEVLDALEHIYMFRNGAISNGVADAIFARIDYGKEDWNDAFALTYLFRTWFAPVACINTANLAVMTGINSATGPNILSALRVTYSFPWPVANVISKGAMRTHRRIFVLLLQIQRSKQALERRFTRNLVAMLMTDCQSLRAVMLRRRMLWFVNTIFSYLTDVVLAAATTDMHRRMSRSGDLDDMITIYQTYITRLDEQCLLSDKRKPVLQAITSILDLVLLFTKTCTPFKSQHPSMDRKGPKSSVVMDRGLSRRRPPGIELDLSDSDANEAEVGLNHNHGMSSGLSSRLSSARLKNIHDTFVQLQGFVCVSLRGSDKGGEDTSTEMLVDMLSAGQPMGGSQQR